MSSTYTITPADVREGDVIRYDGITETVVEVYPHPVLAPAGSAFAGREVFKWDGKVSRIEGLFYRRVKVGTPIELVSRAGDAEALAAMQELFAEMAH